jgi:hypothetical protein
VTPPTARDEVLAAVAEHGWKRVEYLGGVTYRKGSRRAVHIAFDLYGRVTHLSITNGGGKAWNVSTKRRAAAIKELTR